MPRTKKPKIEWYSTVVQAIWNRWLFDTTTGPTWWSLWQCLLFFSSRQVLLPCDRCFVVQRDPLAGLVVKLSVVLQRIEFFDSISNYLGFSIVVVSRSMNDPTNTTATTTTSPSEEGKRYRSVDWTVLGQSLKIRRICVAYFVVIATNAILSRTMVPKYLCYRRQRSSNEYAFPSVRAVFFYI